MIETFIGVSVPTEEQETTISYSRNEQEALVWTSDQTQITKLDKLCEASPNYYKQKSVTLCKQDKRPVCKEYILTDKAVISLRAGRNNVKMTEEQKELKREQMQKLRAEGKL